MALADSGKAIGAATRLLAQRLKARTGMTDVKVGRPERGKGSNKQFNLFLYETIFDPSLKNTPLDEGQPPPLWLVLKYLLTAYDTDGESDTEEALELLGEGARALQELNFLNLNGMLDPNIVKALADNPEDLKITFDEAPVDLLSKVMQGTDEQYRLSIAFQVRPVMIATGEPASYSLLVGVDYSAPSPVIIGERGRQIEVLPSLGPVITELSPVSFEPGDVLTIRGSDLHLSDLSVMLGPVELPIIAQTPDQLKCRVDPAAVNGATISAGGHVLAVTQTLKSGRQRSSNLLVGNLLPVLTAVSVVPPISAGALPNKVFTTINLTGKLLGKTEGKRTDDDIVLALYRDGVTVKMFDVLTIPPPPLPTPPPQEQKWLVMTAQDAVSEGEYLVLLRVNGQQARQGFAVNLVP